MKKIPAMVNPLAEAVPPQPGRRRFVRQVALGAAAFGGLALAAAAAATTIPRSRSRTAWPAAIRSRTA
nr:hypothetical protein [Pseudorhodoferax sp. Leaf265]